MANLAGFRSCVRPNVRHTATLVVRVGLLILPFWLVAVTANAQIFTVLGTFDGSNGEYPQAGLTLSGNTLYGTTQNGRNLSLNSG